MTTRARTAVLAALLTILVAGPAAAQVTPATPHVLAGPSADIVGVSDLAVARDGTGGLLFLENVSGVQHVFLSRLLNGVFSPPQQLDAGLSGVSSQPVLAAGNGGVLLTAFINNGALWVADANSGTQPVSAPNTLITGAENPAISMSNFGKAYLAFSVLGDGGHDVRAAYWANGSWSLEPTPLNLTPGDDAGDGAGRPAVVASGDGTGIVAWGEQRHIYTRRVWADNPSTGYQQADVPSLNGWSEASSSYPVISSGGDSSYAAVGFQEELASGRSQQSRVLMRRLHAGVYDGLVQADGLSTPGPEGADQPAVASDEYGEGWLISARDSSNGLYGLQFGQNEAPGGLAKIDSLTNTAPPDATVTGLGYHAALIVWQQTPGQAGLPEVRYRFFDSQQLEPEGVLSSPDQGGVDGLRGILAAGDIAADGAVAWIQGSGPASQVVTDQLYQPPGSFAPLTDFAYVRTVQPTLAWSAAREEWGPMTYTVTFDGEQVGTTTGTAFALPAAASQGRHTWSVSGANPAGLQRFGGTSTIFVDTVAPVVTAKITGHARVGRPIHVTVLASDAPPPLTAAQASGIATVRIGFGDRSSYLVHHGKFHVYRRARTYRIVVTVTDRAGNVTRQALKLRIRAKAKPHHHHHHGHG